MFGIKRQKETSRSSFLGGLDLCVFRSALVLDGDGAAVVLLPVHGRLVQVRVGHVVAVLVLVVVLVLGLAVPLLGGGAADGLPDGGENAAHAHPPAALGRRLVLGAVLVLGRVSVLLGGAAAVGGDLRGRVAVLCALGVGALLVDRLLLVVRLGFPGEAEDALGPG